jgi:hypothetical protein
MTVLELITAGTGTAERSSLLPWRAAIWILLFAPGIALCEFEPTIEEELEEFDFDLREPGETVFEDRAYDLLIAARAINLDADDESVSGSEARAAS